jgi:hypothetical protein
MFLVKNIFYQLLVMAQFSCTSLWFASNAVSDLVKFQLKETAIWT